eukprot:TRINITY_DN12176_c0_g2_i1.p1 TRINITY_DN12176_c0_g2~~TRINITY_DN12176_c0_g2_i1.p1  ORF type:complete len:104 (-),score=0.16 TRINITY_DN12176_c0_g2_i1:86-397(-)
MTGYSFLPSPLIHFTLKRRIFDILMAFFWIFTFISPFLNFRNTSKNSYEFNCMKQKGPYRKVLMPPHVVIILTRSQHYTFLDINADCHSPNPWTSNREAFNCL